MHDMHRAARLPAQADQQRDGGFLPGSRARFEKAAVGAWVTQGSGLGLRSGMWLELGVRQERQAMVAQHRHRREQVGLAGVWKLVNPGMNQKRLAAEHTARSQAGQLRDVAGDHAAPEPDIDEALPAARLELLL